MHDALPIWVDEEWGAAVVARLGVAREAGAFGRQIFEARPLGLGQVARETHRSDRHPPRRVFIDAERGRAARQARQMLDPGDHATDERDIAVEMAWRVTDDRVQFGADRKRVV